MPEMSAFSGTMVAAVLESVGNRYQSLMLDQLLTSIQNELGGLIYLVGIVAAIFAMAIRGQYRMSAWLIIGPPLFFSVLNYRVEIEDVQWLFGRLPRDQARVQQELQRIAAEQGTAALANARVPKLYARYTKLVSSSTQEIVRMLNRNRNNTDRWFLLRAQIFTNLRTQAIDDPGFKELVEWAFFGECRQSIEAARVVADPQSTTQQRTAAGFVRQLDSPQPTVRLTRTAASYAASLMLANPGTLGGPTNEAALSRGPEWVRLSQSLQQRPFTCREIWTLVYQALMSRGVIVVEQAMQLGARNNIEPAALLGQLAEAAGVGTGTDGAAGDDTAENLSRLSRVVALYLFRNASRPEGSSGRIASLAARNREFRHIEIPMDSELALTELTRTTSTEWSEKTRLMMAASNLPYYQGLLLFFLSVSYPCFAMLLLVPGKHAGFIMWFVLWLWVKSWDIGMAVVMQLDDILFSMLRQQTRPRQGADMLRNDMEWAVAVIREIDPTFHISTYYNIMAVCLLSIPVVSSQLILGSLSGGAGLVAAGMQLFAGDLARSANSTQVQSAVSNMRYEINEHQRSHTETTLQNRLGLPQQSFGGPTPGGMQLHRTGDRYQLASPEQIITKPMAPIAKLGGYGEKGYGSKVGSAITNPTIDATQTLTSGLRPGIKVGRAKPLTIAAGDPLRHPTVSSKVPRRPGDPADGDDPIPRSEPFSTFQRLNAHTKAIAGLQGIFSAAKSPTTFSFDLGERLMTLFGKRISLDSVLYSKRDYLRASIRGIGGVGEGVLSAARLYGEEAVRQDIKVTKVHASNDALYSDRGKRLAFMIKLYGALEVPIASKELADTAEADRMWALRRREYEGIALMMNGLATGIEAGNEIAKMRAHNRGMLGGFERFISLGGNPGSVDFGDPRFRSLMDGLSNRQLGRLLDHGFRP